MTPWEKGKNERKDGKEEAKDSRDRASIVARTGTGRQNVPKDQEKERVKESSPMRQEEERDGPTRQEEENDGKEKANAAKVKASSAGNAKDGGTRNGVVPEMEREPISWRKANQDRKSHRSPQEQGRRSLWAMSNPEVLS